jgi:hypothetical protein
MEQNDMETLIRNIDARTKRIEQILPKFVTKEDAKAFAAKEDLKSYPTREEMRAVIREEGEITRQHFNAVAERIEQSVKVIAEGHEATSPK